MSESGPRLSVAALVSFLLGLASLALCLLGLTGVPALLLGWLGLRAVNAGGGRLTGARLAVAGMLLGGIGTLATLAGVAAVVVVQVQSSAARTNCQDNLRRLGVAVTRYGETHKSFPPAVVGPRGLPPERQLSWLSEMVPLLGNAPGGLGSQRLEKRTSRHFEEVYALIDRTKPWADEANLAAVETPLRVLRCPGDAGFDPAARAGLTNYVGLAGIGPDAAALRRDDPRAGLFGYDRGAVPKEMAGGASHTIAALETLRDLGPWPAGGWPTVRDLAPDVERYGGPGRPFGGTHRGMMNVLYADGSMRPFSDGTLGEVLRRQATLGREAAGE